MALEPRHAIQGMPLRRESDGKLLIRRGLLALRLGLGSNILYWGIIALLGPARGKILFATLPGLDVGPELAVFLAVGEIALGVFISMGLMRGISYGLGFFVQAVALFASHTALLSPLAGDHALWAGLLPVLVAQGVLFVLRGEDRYLAVDSLLIDWASRASVKSSKHAESHVSSSPPVAAP